MAQIENLSAVGRGIFFKGLSNMDAPLYFSEKDFDKSSAIKISTKNMQLESGRLVFLHGLGLERLAEKSCNMFFNVSGIGYFCPIKKIIAGDGKIFCPIPEYIKKIPTEMDKSSTTVEGKVYYNAKSSTIEIPLKISERFSKIKNICEQLCREKKLVSEKALDLVFINQNFIIFSSEEKNILQENQIYLVDLSFKISPILKRKITLGCVVTERAKKHCYCHLCKITHAKEEDKRFLGQLGTRNI